MLDRELAYPCGCSRKDLANVPRGPLGTIYPGTCRAGCDASETAIRLLTDDEPISFDDALQGRQTQCLESESGDFVIRRRDGLIAYQLAVVVDDALEGVTEVVRGIDIMDSTARQIRLQRLLGYSEPAYMHFPVITHTDGDKLSKLTSAPGIPMDEPRPLLVAALQALQHAPPMGLETASIQQIWQWATANWAPSSLIGLKTVSIETLPGNVLTDAPDMP